MVWIGFLTYLHKNQGFQSPPIQTTTQEGSPDCLKLWSFRCFRGTHGGKMESLFGRIPHFRPSRFPFSGHKRGPLVGFYRLAPSVFPFESKWKLLGPTPQKIGNHRTWPRVTLRSTHMEPTKTPGPLRKMAQKRTPL